jgi:hypothetical protein
LSPQIVAVSGPLAGRSFPLSAGPLTFGRTPDNAVVIVSPAASRRHAEVRPEGGQFVLHDLGSSNGTLVNGQRLLAPHALRPGDVFQIGDEQFRFEAPAPAFDKTLLATPQPLGDRQPQQPPPPQQPLPPLPHSPTPPPPHSLTPPLPHSPTPPLPHSPPAARRSRLPLLLAIGAVVACALIAALAGGALVVARALGPGDTPTAAAGFGDEPPAAPTRAPAAADAAKWTVLVYLDGDNNLEPDALADFREMAAVGSSDALKIVVQLDRVRSREEWDDTSAGDWGGTRRFLVERGMEPEPDAALENLGELNMGDPATLADFIAWGVGAYPADRYALIIWDHGSSWLGVASDDSSDGDALALPELSAALQTARDRSGYGTFDLIGFDACLMAQLDVLAAIAPYGQVAVASAELEPNQGWAWDAWLAALAADPAQDGAAIAPAIVDSYIASYANTGDDDVTLSAFDLAQIDGVAGRLDALAGAMIGALGRGYSPIGQARSFADTYAPSYAEAFSAVDLGHFASLLPEQGAAGEVAEAATALGSAIGQARIANGAGSYHRNTSGLSIYFPQVAGAYVDAYERGSPLPRSTRWADFLKAFHAAGDTAVARPSISDLQVSAPVASAGAPVTLSGAVGGEDIAYIFSFIGVPNAARDTVELVAVDFIYPPGAAPGGAIPAWDAGPYSLSLDWDASSWYLDNGADQIPVLLGPVKYGSGFYGVEGVYTSQATGEQIDAGLIFTVDGGAGRLVRIWGFPRSGGGQEPQPYELTPAPGDSFTAYTRSYTDAGGELRPGSVAGQTITFGEQPLTARLGPTAEGDYVVGFLVRDIAGGYSYQYVDVTAAN